MTTARERLLERIMAHVAEAGLSDTSLRDLAEATGTSHRMLIYHFGGREGLVAAIVESMEAQQRTTLLELAESTMSADDAVRSHWATLTNADVAPFIRLFFEVVAHALHGRPGTEGFLDQLTGPWIEAGLAASERLGGGADEIDILLGIAVTRGLLLEATASGDPGQATAALERFLAMRERQP